MSTDATLLNALEEAQGRNPLEFPYGFFLEDEYAGSAGGCFFWYTTEAELHNALQNDLIEVLSDDNAQDKTLAKQAIAMVLEAAAKQDLDELELLATLNELLKDIEVQIQFLGSFEQLRKSKLDWCRYLREEFREDYLEDIDDLTEKKLQASIKKPDQENFAEFILDYLL